jgi:anti-sigma B factor antagonist
MASAVVERRTGLDGSVVVELRGELDLASEQAFKALLVDLAEEGPPAIVVDMRHVTFIDSTGIGALVAGYHAAHTAGVAYRVGRVAPFVERQLRTTGLYERLVGTA